MVINPDTLEIEIVNTEAIDGGVQVFARAWSDGVQIGFGKDGTVDMERFRIFNPPVLVDDPNGDIVQESEFEGQIYTRTLREDAQQALLQVVSGLIATVGKQGNNIIAGKVGNTTSTFYPAAGANSPVDGRIYVSNSTWALSRDDTSGDAVEVSSANTVMVQGEFVTTYPISRNPIFFDTSTIGTDTISSAVLSVHSNAAIKNLSEATNPANLALVSANTAATNNLVVADFAKANWGTTRYATDILLSTFGASSAYYDFTLNGDGLAFINKTGVSKFGIRPSNDLDNNAPTARSFCFGYYADDTGTTRDPKLVVEHAAGGPAANLSARRLHLMSM